MRDLVGYKIGVHRDIPSKVITTQFYLPASHNQGKDIGTIFYRASKTGEPGKHRIVKQQPFEPNSGYSFAVGGDSFHGVEALEAENAPRDSLMLTFYLDKDTK